MAKRDIIIEAIEEGGATREALMEAAEVDSKGLASQFSYLRLMGKCPIADDEGVYSFVTADEWEEIKEVRKANAKSNQPAKTPEERLEAAEKRVDKCKKAAANAADRFNKSDDDHELELRSNKCDIELELAEIELEKAQANMPD